MAHYSFDYYAELELKRSCTDLDIIMAYRRLVKTSHSDKSEDNVEAATIKVERVSLYLSPNIHTSQIATYYSDYLSMRA